MLPRDRSNLVDILEASRLAGTFIANTTLDEFLVDPMRQSAVIRQLEVIGEATKRLSQECRDEHPDIPWKQMAGMRDILIHAYDHIDMDQVYRAVKNTLPQVVVQISRLAE